MRTLSQLVVLITACTFVFASCSGDEKGAKKYLSQAEESLRNGNYDLAKLKIDSIRILFPKAYNEIKSGMALMQDVRMAENKRNIAFCDSMLRVNYALLNEMLENFNYVRDERYQEFGEYQPKSYPFSASLNQNGLRAGVTEQGRLFLESILVGTALKHHKIHVSTKEGSFAESQSVTSDGLNYSFRTSERNYEIVRFTGDDENGVGKFIYSFQNEPLTLQFIGNRNISVHMSSPSKKAIAQSFELSSLLLDIEQLKFEKEKSEILIRYLESRKN